jgi:hypothetical protein
LDEPQEMVAKRMTAVDTAFAEGGFTLGEELDAWLEQRLGDLDHRLSELDEAPVTCGAPQGGIGRSFGVALDESNGAARQRSE